MARNVLFLLLLLTLTSGFSQNNLNAYKYVIVPNQYDFLKSADQFQLNSLSEFLFNKHGFIALMEDSEFPEDLIKNRCLALKSDVARDKNLFKTKLNVVLKDCNDKIVYTSKAGESREKEYKIAYNQALRAAFKTFSTLNYKYEPATTVTVGSPKQLKPIAEKEIIEKEIIEEENIKKIEQPATVLNTQETVTNTANILYAQAMTNGYQLVDSSPKVLYKILKTGLKDVFMLKGQEAIIYRFDEQWIMEYYENGSIQKKVLNIKF